MYNSFNEFFENFKGIITGEVGGPVIGLLILIGIIFLILLGNANSSIFNKILNLAASIFGIWWSIGIINVPNWEYSEGNQTVIYIFTAIFFSLIVTVYLGPLMWSEEKAETTYYIVLGTLLSETEYSGGMKGLAIASTIILAVGGFVGTAAARAMGFVTSGIIGIIIYIGLIALNVVSIIKLIKDHVS